MEKRILINVDLIKKAAKGYYKVFVL